MTGSQTVTTRPIQVQTERMHDYLYDKDYQVSGQRDHMRQTHRAKTNEANIAKMYKYKTMFSELSHHSRYEQVLQQTDPVPQFINRSFQDRATSVREASFKFGAKNVGGKDRYKFFERPRIPYIHEAPADVILQQPSAQIASTKMSRDHSTSRTVACQTDYRDQESQTDPYTPQYKVKPGEYPEILTLSELKYRRGLPAGVEEVAMIERARDKRKWEESLPPLSDLDQIEKRREMMEEREKFEWKVREEQIEQVQNMRLEALKQILNDREATQKEIAEERLDRTVTKQAKITDEKIAKYRKEHIKDIRRLQEKRNKVEGSLQPRDIVNDYTNYASEVYAPFARHGIFPDRGSQQYNVKSKYLDTYQGLCELEATLGSGLLETSIEAPVPPKGPNTDGFVKRKERQEWDLKEIHEDIKRNKKEKYSKNLEPRLLQKVPKPEPRPQTPTQTGPGEDYEERQNAAIVLQKMLRGAAVKARLRRELGKRIDLVKEIRSTHILLESERKSKESSKLSVLDSQHSDSMNRMESSYVGEIVQSVSGKHVAKLLDFLSKELIRLQDERRCHAFTLLAERKRRLREAKEAGQRQEEERRRREEDEIWRQVLKTRQESVDKFLLAIANKATHTAAAELAEKEIMELSSRIDLNEDNLSNRDLAADLVHNFLIPEVVKKEQRTKHESEREARIIAVKNILYQTNNNQASDAPSE